MKATPTAIEDVLLVEPDIYLDRRGFFQEVFHAAKFADLGLPCDFVQDNHSQSRPGVLRGLHYQLGEPQGKLVRAVTGAIYDVAVDIRKGSPSFGRYVGVELSGDNHLQLYIPPGFAHGFCVLAGPANVSYKCTSLYDPAAEHGLAWDDPDIGIDWPAGEFVISDKDAANPRLRDLADRLPVLGPVA